MIYTLRELKEYLGTIPKELEDYYVEIETITGSRRYKGLSGDLNFIDYIKGKNKVRIQFCVYEKEIPVEKVKNPYCSKPYIASDKNGRKVKICRDVKIDGRIKQRVIFTFIDEEDCRDWYETYMDIYMETE